MTLAVYKKKRNFKKTPEPLGIRSSKKKKLSFVVQRHHASHLHYDFRLEMEGVLKSWAVPKGPSMVAGEKRLAVQVEDHPLPYGKFYGEIPKGNYGAGIVEIWDKGTYLPMEKGENEKVLQQQLKKGDLKFNLNGTYLKGAFALVRMKGDNEKNWLLIKKSDEFAAKNFKIDIIPALKSPAKKSSVKKKFIPI
jgi:bifunctional non-homologous end joining protein LigD